MISAPSAAKFQRYQRQEFGLIDIEAVIAQELSAASESRAAFKRVSGVATRRPARRHAHAEPTASASGRPTD